MSERARARSRVENTLRMPKVDRRLLHLVVMSDRDFVPRPETRAACENGQRPCVFVSCKYNLYLDVHPRTRNIQFNFPDREPDEMPPGGSCALDIADKGGATLEEVGDLLNVTRERVRQLEADGLRKLRNARTLRGLAGDYVDTGVISRHDDGHGDGSE